MTPPFSRDYRVLILAPFGRDGGLIAQVLQQSGYPVEIAQNVDDIVRGADGENRAGAALIAEEALDERTIEILARKITSQASWSDFPIIVLTGGGLSTPYTEMAVRSRAAMGNITLIERPLRPATLLSSVQTALRARRRQYEICDIMLEREQTAEELREARDNLESIVEQRTSALRELSGKLLQVQDEERRRIARELHDGMGQYLSATKLNLDILSNSEKIQKTEILSEATRLLDHAIADIRTLSYLLHPPLLDEAGFESAARWFMEGFAKRSGIAVEMKIDSPPERLPQPIEFALFRTLQEALTNVHRHSGSKSVKVSLAMHPEKVVLKIKDKGCGVPAELVERLRRNGVSAGVGLAGIRERLKELDGEFTIISNSSGTQLIATVPLPRNKTSIPSEATVAQEAMLPVTSGWNQAPIVKPA